MTDKKRTNGLDWEAVRFFAALARHGTLAGTARGLKVTHATVARRLANLESTLGQSLFARNASGFSLNATGATAPAGAQLRRAHAGGVCREAAAARAVDVDAPGRGAAGASARGRGSSRPGVRGNFVRE
jgi:DNA-binding transcriptional LysR family regulator